MLAAAPAWAEEAAATITDAAVDVADAPVTEAIKSGLPNASEFLILLTPLGLYAVWSLYRDKINPRSTFSDYLLLVVALAIAANLVSMVAFKIRLF
eukprot:gene20690-27489_t